MGENYHTSEPNSRVAVLSVAVLPMIKDIFSLKRGCNLSWEVLVIIFVTSQNRMRILVVFG